MSDRDQYSDPLGDMVRARAEQRRTSGLVPPDLEERLDAHAQAVAARREAPLARLRRLAEALRQPQASGVGQGLAGRLKTARAALGGTLSVRVDRMAKQTGEALLALADALDSAGPDPAGIGAHLDAIADRVEELLAEVNRLAGTVTELQAELREKGGAPPGGGP